MDDSPPPAPREQRLRERSALVKPSRRRSSSTGSISPSENIGRNPSKYRERSNSLSDIVRIKHSRRGPSARSPNTRYHTSPSYSTDSPDTLKRVKKNKSPKSSKTSKNVHYNDGSNSKSKNDNTTGVRSRDASPVSSRSVSRSGSLDDIPSRGGYSPSNMNVELDATYRGSASGSASGSKSRGENLTNSRSGNMSNTSIRVSGQTSGSNSGGGNAHNNNNSGSSGRDRTSTTASTGEVLSPSKQKLKDLVKNYITILLIVIIVGPAIIFVCIAVRAALRPGLLYCSATECPSDLESVISDTAMIIIGLIAYAFFFFLAFLILVSSGSWMHHAFRNKIIAISSLYVMFWSIFQLIAPAAHRAYVIPYSVANPSTNFTFNVSSSSSVIFSASDFYSEYYRDKNLQVALQVFKVPNTNVEPHTVNPFFDMIYSDRWDQVTTVVPDVFIERTVDNLKDFNYYLWILFPAKKGGSDAYPSTDFLQPVIALNTTDLHTIYNGTLSTQHKVFVDVRGFVVCLWDSTVGCM